MFQYFLNNKDEAFEIYDKISETVLEETEITRENISDILLLEWEWSLDWKDLIKNFDENILNDVSKKLSFFVIWTILSKLEKFESKSLDSKSLEILEVEFENLESIWEIMYRYYFEFIYKILIWENIVETLEDFKNKDTFDINYFINIYLNSFEWTVLVYSDKEEEFSRELEKQSEKLIFIIEDIINIFQLDEEYKYDLYIKIWDIFKDLWEFKYSYNYYDLAWKTQIKESYLSYNHKFLLFNEMSEENNETYLQKSEENLDIFIQNSINDNNLYNIWFWYFNKFKAFSPERITDKHYFILLNSLSCFDLFLKYDENIENNKEIEVIQYMIYLMEEIKQHEVEHNFNFKWNNYKIIINIRKLKEKLFFLDKENFDENFKEIINSWNKFLTIDILLNLFNEESSKKNKEFYWNRLIILLDSYFNEILINYEFENVKIISSTKPVYKINWKWFSLDIDKRKVEKSSEIMFQINLYRFNEIIEKYKEDKNNWKFVFKKNELNFIKNFLLKYQII